MRLLIYLRDGRTVYFLERRARLYELTQSVPWNEKPSVRVAKGTWNPTTGEYIWRAVKLRHLAHNSISHVEEASGIEAARPLELIEEEATDGA